MVDWPMLRVIQINLQHSKTVSAALLLRLLIEDVELILVQEPWVIGNSVCGLNTKGYRLAYIQNSGKPRDCVMVKNNINSLLVHRFSDKDTVTMVVEVRSVSFWITSSYLAPEYGLAPPQ